MGFHPGATPVELNLDRLQIDPVLKFIEQPRLAQSRVADHDDRSALVVFHHPTEHILQGAEFALPADHARFHTFYSAPPGPERSSLATQNAIDRHRLRKSLGRHRLFRFEVEHPTDMLIRMMRDQDGSRFGQTFQPGGQIDGQAGNRVFAFGAAADEHHAGVDADPDLKPGKPALRFQLRGDLGRRCQNIETCQNGRIRIVLPGNGQSESSLEAVTLIANDLPAKLTDRFRQSLQRPVDDFHDLFRIATLDESSMVGHIHEKYGSLRAARLWSALWRQGTQLGLQRGNGGVDDAVIDSPPQAFLNGDGLFQLQLITHGASLNPER